MTTAQLLDQLNAQVPQSRVWVPEVRVAITGECIYMGVHPTGYATARSTALTARQIYSGRTEVLTAWVHNMDSGASEQVIQTEEVIQ